MAKRKLERTYFGESANANMISWWSYVERLTELAISVFDWDNLPDTVDARFLELCLFSDGKAVFFKDEVLGYLALQTTINAPLNVYRIPIKRRAYASNGYNKELDIDNSVIIYNNMLHGNSYPMIRYYAQRLWDLDRIIDINAKAQKTPVLVKATEQQRLTLLNVYKAYDGNAPVIFGDKNLDMNDLTAINTGAPYVANQLHDLRQEIWSEALTYIGIENIGTQKRERLLTSEVTKGQGGTTASRFSRLDARRQACDEINKMFGLNIEVSYKDDARVTNLQEDQFEAAQEIELEEKGAGAVQ